MTSVLWAGSLWAQSGLKPPSSRPPCPRQPRRDSDRLLSRVWFRLDRQILNDEISPAVQMNVSVIFVVHWQTTTNDLTVEHEWKNPKMAPMVARLIQTFNKWNDDYLSANVSCWNVSSAVRLDKQIIHMVSCAGHASHDRTINLFYFCPSTSDRGNATLTGLCGTHGNWLRLTAAVDSLSGFIQMRVI